LAPTGLLVEQSGLIAAIRSGRANSRFYVAVLFLDLDQSSRYINDSLGQPRLGDELLLRIAAR